MRGSEERAELGMALGAKEEGWGRQHPRVSFQGIIKGQLRKSLRTQESWWGRGSAKVAGEVG